jgi:TonB family protein
MKRALCRLISPAFLLLAGAALPAAETAVKQPIKPPDPIHRVSPVHPLELKKKFIAGKALVSCLITETGAIEEVKVVSATRPEFGQAAEEALRQWTFRPGEKDGQPVAVRINIPFDFALSNDWIIETLMQRSVFQEIHEDIIPARELPAWPRPLHILMPRYPESLQGSGKYGKAVVSIVINKEGRVMNPKIVKATYPEFVLPALVAAARLEFPPQVMANREHIYVAMDLQFDFKAEKKTDKPRNEIQFQPEENPVGK